MKTRPKIRAAVACLKNNISHIHSVAEWADQMRYSRSYFSTLIKKEFHTPPRKIIRREKYRKIIQLVREKPDQKGVVMARKIGFENVKSLYEFLHYNFDINLSELRKQSKKGLLG